MKNKTIVWVIVILIILVGGYFLLLRPAPAHDGNSPANAAALTAYTDVRNGFSIGIPAGATDRQPTDPAVVYSENLPFAKGTNLGEKYLEVKVSRAASCSVGDQGVVEATSTVSSNGKTFLKETGTGVGAGQIYDTTTYSTSVDGVCYQLNFVLHSSNPAMYGDNPPPTFDRAAESKIFDSIFASFKISGPAAAAGGASATTRYTNIQYGMQFRYPSKYEPVRNSNPYLVRLEYTDPAAKGTGQPDFIRVSALKTDGAASFKDFLAKHPIENQNSGAPIPFLKFSPVTINNKVFYYIVGERFEGIFSVQYYYYTPANVYLFETHSYIGEAWTDPNFNEQTEPVHADLKQALQTLSFSNQ